MNAWRAALVMNFALLIAASSVAAQEQAAQDSVAPQQPAADAPAAKDPDAQAPAAKGANEKEPEKTEAEKKAAELEAERNDPAAKEPEPVPMLVRFPGVSGSEITVPVVQTYVQMRYRDMVRQAYDVSCGAAALATIVKYFYGRDVTERKIIDQILDTADQDTKTKIQKDGFSMLELKREGERLGFQAGGFRIPELESLVKLKVPAITLINSRGYDHFVVIRGIEDGMIYIADPAFGNRTRTLESFAGEWRNVILVFLSKDETGEPAFRRTSQVHGRADEIFSIIDRGIPTMRPLPGEF